MDQLRQRGVNLVKERRKTVDKLREYSQVRIDSAINFIYSIFEFSNTFNIESLLIWEVILFLQSQSKTYSDVVTVNLSEQQKWYLEKTKRLSDFNNLLNSIKKLSLSDEEITRVGRFFETIPGFEVKYESPSVIIILSKSNENLVESSKEENKDFCLEEFLGDLEEFRQSEMKEFVPESEKQEECSEDPESAVAEEETPSEEPEVAVPEEETPSEEIVEAAEEKEVSEDAVTVEDEESSLEFVAVEAVEDENSSSEEPEVAVAEEETPSEETVEAAEEKEPSEDTVTVEGEESSLEFAAVETVEDEDSSSQQPSSIEEELAYLRQLL